MPEVKIAPSILSADFARLGEELEAVMAAGADVVHVDVMDGRFVPNLTIGPPVVKALRRLTDAPFDVHLMIVEPDDLLEAFIDAGANRISVHAEACRHLHRTLDRIRRLKVEPSVALNPATPLSAVEHVLELCTQVLVMTVNPGFGGQSFIEAMLPKVRALRAMAEAKGIDLDIQVDGGVDARTIAAVAEAGANVFVSGTGVFKDGPEGYAPRIAELRRIAQDAR